MKVQCLTFVFAVIEIPDLSGCPETALMIRVFVLRGLSKQMASGVTYAENDSFFVSYVFVKPGRDSSVSIVTRFGLDGPGDRIPMGRGEIFRVGPDRPWGPSSFL